MLAHRLVDRPTQDVNMFTPKDDVTPLGDALVAALHHEGLLVVDEARSTTYMHGAPWTEG